MEINKTTVTRKVQKTGSVIEVKIERGTWDERILSDGWDTGTTKTHLVDSTTITLRDKRGKLIAQGNGVSMLTPATYFNHKDLVAKGAIARVGDAFITQGALDLINEALSEADAATPRTARQIEIETEIAKAAAARAKHYEKMADKLIELLETI